MENLPESWSDLSDEEKAALLEMATARLFWRSFWNRLGWLKHAGTIVLTLGAAATLMKDTLVSWLLSTPTPPH